MNLIVHYFNVCYITVLSYLRSKHKEAASKAFQNCGVPVDFRKLAVGDYLWICKPRPESGLNPDQELILPYVVERKRLDDLVQSIKDGRFKEQKVGFFFSLFGTELKFYTLGNSIAHSFGW